MKALDAVIISPQTLGRKSHPGKLRRFGCGSKTVDGMNRHSPVSVKSARPPDSSFFAAVS
jgi:hypothetical protein